jgi:small subunit ribosomal protein S20
VANGETEQAASLLTAATRKLDQAAAKNLIHANKAARTKSRLAKLVNKAGE